MQIPWFDIKRQNKLIKESFLKEVEKILDSGNICMGKLCDEFERKWAEMNGAKYCVLVSSGTDALTLTIDALGIKGLVLTPCVSFIATPNAVSLNRQKVLFCETDNNGNIDIKHAISRHYNQRLFNPIQAIVGVGMYGNPPDMENLQKLAQSTNIPFILDAAQCHLGTFNNKPLIEYCDVLTHSFYITKNLGCFTECGAILTNNKELYEKIKSLRNHGRGDNQYEFSDIGYNARPSEIAAASLLVKLPFLEGWTSRRIEIANKYNELLKPLKDAGKLRCLDVPENVKCVFHLFPVFIKNRDIVRKKLLEAGIETQMQYHLALHQQNSYKELGQGPFEIAELLCNQVLTLPCFPELTNEEIDYVSKKLIEVIDNE